MDLITKLDKEFAEAILKVKCIDPIVQAKVNLFKVLRKELAIREELSTTDIDLLYRLSNDREVRLHLASEMMKFKIEE